jgi:acid phosphatase (class A)
MRQRLLLAIAIALFVTTGLMGQVAIASAKQSTSEGSPEHTNSYIDTSAVDFGLILPAPAAQNSSITAIELTELHRIELERKPTEITQAKLDDSKEDIFLFRGVMGEEFTAESLPFTATFSGRIRKEESIVNGPLKKGFHRARPYQADNTLHPVCPVTTESNSYPSGHSLSGYLFALTLVQMVPEKRDQIFKRADEYAQNRLICGVHYLSDVEASRKLAYAMFGALAASPRFQEDLSAARNETRRKLGLPGTGTP